MIRKAIESDLDAIVDIKDAAVEIFKTEGNPQWDAEYPTRASFQQDIADDSLYVYVQDGRVAGFACINSDEPPEYLALTWRCPGPSLFLHRVAIDPAARKSGIASKLLAFAEQLARSRGAKSIRTDTFSGNKKMHGLFEKMGYERVPGTIQIRGLGVDFYCFETSVKSDSLPHVIPLDLNELEPAMALVWDVFCEFEAPDYSDEGVAEFKDYIRLDAMGKRIKNGDLLLWGCYIDNLLVGVSALRPDGHISLFFVDRRHHKKGYGSLLFDAMRDCAAQAKSGAMTVNSSPFAVAVYKKLGFASTGPEQVINGLRFTPMRLELNNA